MNGVRILNDTLCFQTESMFNFASMIDRQSLRSGSGSVVLERHLPVVRLLVLWLACRIDLVEVDGKVEMKMPGGC